MTDDLSDDQPTRSSDRWWAQVETDHGVLLRELGRSDAPGVFAVHSDPRVYQHDPQETHPDLAHTQRFLDPMLGHWAAHGFGYWTVLLSGQDWPDGPAGPQPSDAGRVIAGLGGIQHHSIQGVPVFNVYFRFAPAAQGRGLARTVLEHVIRLAPAVAPGQDIVVRTRPGNVAARRVAERAGFTDEGLEPGTTDMQLLRLRLAPADPAVTPATAKDPSH